MRMGKRVWLVGGGLMIALAACAVVENRYLTAAEQSGAGAGDQAEREGELGNLIHAMGIGAKLQDHRFDFSFAATYNKSEWNLSMSAVLSQDGNAVWVMAWLDQLPRSAADVPRTALLSLLSKNDTLGNGKFFAYIPSNRRFVLERVIPYGPLTTVKLREALQDLAASVVECYPSWSVENWKGSHAAQQAESAPQKSAPAELATETRRADVERTGANQ
jgi:hypothetical protein